MLQSRGEGDRQSKKNLGSKMIDAPVVKRALRTIRLAEQNGLLNPKWRESDEG